MSRYNDDNHRGHAADADYIVYSSNGNGGRAATHYPRMASPGHTTYNGGTSQARLTYEPQSPFYPRPPSPPSALQVPDSRLRPRSIPPPLDARRSSHHEDGTGTGIATERERGYNKYGDSDDSDDGKTRAPIERARKIVGGTFSDSKTGLGAGVLGALVGGLAAREAVDLTQHKGGQGHRNQKEAAEHKRNQLISTVVGAAIGALGANAVEKRIEIRRAKDEVKQDKWERKWKADTETLEKREIVARPRSSRGHDHGHHKGERDAWDEERKGGDGRRGVEREVDTGTRSWMDVEDWVSHVREDVDGRPRSSGQREGLDSYHY